MGNCQKNRLSESLHNHCPQFFLDCFQSILSDSNQQSNSYCNQEATNRYLCCDEPTNKFLNENHSFSNCPNRSKFFRSESNLIEKNQSKFNRTIYDRLPDDRYLEIESTLNPLIQKQSFRSYQCIYHCRQSPLQNNKSTDFNGSSSSLFSATLQSPSSSIQRFEQRQKSIIDQQLPVHCLQHLSHCQYNTTGGSTTPIQIKQSSRLKIKIQERLLAMHRQRSASHCPHADGHRKDRNGRPKCLCYNQKEKTLDEQQNEQKYSRKQGETSNVVVDPLVNMVWTKNKNSIRHSNPCSSPSSSGTGTLSMSNIGKQKRASSLRVLNKRFNFFETNNDSPTNNQGFSSNHSDLNESAGSIIRRGSKKHPKRFATKLNDLDDQCFLAIFEYLTLQEKLIYERVCHRWQRLIRGSLQAPASLNIGEHSVKCECQCSHFINWDLPPSKRFDRDKSGYIIYPKSVIKYLLTLCSQLRCINFSHCYIDDQTLQVN